MRKMTYDQINKELQTALESIDNENYEIETDTDWITVVPGHFAYHVYNVNFNEIVLPCGIKIDNIYAIYPDSTCTTYNNIPNDENYGHDWKSDTDWDVPDDLQIFEDEEEINNPDGTPYSEDYFIDGLSVTLETFLNYPYGSFYVDHLANKSLISFSVLTKKWLKETDLNQLSPYEHDLITNDYYNDDDIITKYIEQVASLDVLPDCISLNEMRQLNEEYCGGTLDLSHFEEQ